MATATIPRETIEAPEGAVHAGIVASIEIDKIIVAPNVRENVGDLTELAESIRQHGVLQPVCVRYDSTHWILVYGQRRLAAAKAAGLERIPAIIEPANVDEKDTAVRQLVENLQRADLNPLEEARSFRAILDADPKLTQVELAKRIGRSAPYVSNALRILELDKKVLPLVESGQLTAAHAKAIASLKGKAQRDYAARAVREEWSAHDTEYQVQRFHDQAKREAEKAEEAKAWATATESELAEKGADRKSTTLTTVDGYHWSAQTELAALKAIGWKVKPESWSRGSAKLCDCDAWGVQRTWEGKTRLVRRCIVKKHYDDKLKAEGRRESISWEERSKEMARERAVKEELHKSVEPIFREAFAKLPPNVARILLWSAMDYDLNDWVKQHKGDRKKPDAWGSLSGLTSGELAGELVRHVFRHFDSRYNVKLDLEAIAEAFGAHAKVVVAKAKKGGR